jgi:MFS transporter, ACS family, tartrate transporter
MSVSAIETETMARVSRRSIPFLILCYFIAYLDRVNVGFAALEMNRALGFSPTVYAWGAGIFFIATSCSRFRATSSWSAWARVCGSRGSC